MSIEKNVIITDGTNPALCEEIYKFRYNNYTLTDKVDRFPSGHISDPTDATATHFMLQSSGEIIGVARAMGVHDQKKPISEIIDTSLLDDHYNWVQTGGLLMNESHRNENNVNFLLSKIYRYLLDESCKLELATMQQGAYERLWKKAGFIVSQSEIQCNNPICPYPIEKHKFGIREIKVSNGL